MRNSNGGEPLERPWAFLLALAVFPCALAVLQLGRVHPDEVYQALEPAFFRAHGYGVLAWEWKVGLRNWATPIVLSWMLKGAAALGIDHPRGYRWVVEVPVYLLHVGFLLAVYRYVRRRVDRPGALWATTLVGTYGLVLVFAGRTLSESISTACFVIGLERLDRPEGERRNGFWGGLAMGFSIVARYGSSVLVLTALLYLAARRAWPRLVFACLGGLLVAVGLGILDWVSWGAPFHSFWAYARFNVFSSKAAQMFGREPPLFYVPIVLKNLPLWVWLALPWALIREKPRLSLAGLAAAVYLVAISCTAHKEERFAYPALVLLVLMAAPSLVHWVERIARGPLRALVLVLAVALGAVPILWQPDVRGDQFRAIVRATREGATGLLIVNEGLWGAGGYFYIGKNIPWATCDFAHDVAFRRAMSNPKMNRAVTFGDRALDDLTAAGFRTVAQIGRERILER